MKLAILFWFYKDIETCKNRLELIKKHNPNLKIYGLYGGDIKEIEKYQKHLGEYLDDFYISPYDDPNWKWINGDLMILDWYDKRGKDLDWDSVAVVQWDCLVFDSLEKQFKGIKKNQIFLSGLIELDEKIENQWSWTKPGSTDRRNYLDFKDYVKEEYNFSKILPCCLFIFQIFPKLFFDKYLRVRNKKVGMLEYKVPTYAEIFKISFFDKDLGVWWFDEKARKGKSPMNARAVEVERDFIESELEKKKGFRIFHPYFGIWK